ncbi:hypothetical protein PpBr36_00376 [Pyricularia pennisetigena]|uniref:hypothetical protein n=1 Tax=Pyricularia pennisetigena TaxID=1578925 RepID=UPI0011535037|nr:hypothetical protein PpBr36_00376 [Pyricularia pennisetigena]TLS27796.1 hypothetical protein PpBr36_00376 [Pyricularia pennisetigena]
MSAVSGKNVLRYTALGLGVFYGFTHQRKINADHKAAAARHEYEHKQKLIQQAKAEYARLHDKSGSKNDSRKSDPMDPNFDLESYFTGVIGKA